jgi:hypothetical protein
MEQQIGQIVVVDAPALDGGRQLSRMRRRLHRPFVHRGLGRDRIDRDHPDLLAVPEEALEAVVGDFADDGGVEVPLFEDREDVRLAPLLGDDQHPLLRLGEHDLVRRHAALAHRDAVEVETDTGAGAPRHLERRRGEPRGAHVLDADDASVLHQLEARLEEQFFGERVAHLDGRALLPPILVELGRSHRRAVDAVAAGLRADVNDRIADALRDARKMRSARATAEGEDIDQDVAVVGGVEGGLAADGRDADAVAVARDAADDAVDEVRMRGASSSPKRSESSEAIGRAPIVKTSRRMPPTPVAAP